MNYLLKINKLAFIKIKNLPFKGHYYKTKKAGHRLEEYICATYIHQSS